MTRLNTPTYRSFRTGQPIDQSPERRWKIAKSLAYDRVRYRWGQEMSAKYDVPYTDEEDLDNANLTTTADHRRYTEIADEELAFVARFDPDSSSYEPDAVLPVPSWCAPDEASGMLVSELVDLDDQAIAADLDRIETELRGLREELGDSGAS
jgi:hypothetical protein